MKDYNPFSGILFALKSKSELLSSLSILQLEASITFSDENIYGNRRWLKGYIFACM
jgi:hypothetical protein